MNMKIGIPVLFAVALGCGSALAAEGKVTINSVMPKDIYSKDKITLDYNAIPGPNGDHLHLNVDGKRVEVIRPLSGTVTFGPLAAGTHHVCLAVNTKAHEATGVEGCVDVNVWK